MVFVCSASLKQDCESEESVWRILNCQMRARWRQTKGKMKGQARLIRDSSVFIASYVCHSYQSPTQDNCHTRLCSLILICWFQFIFSSTNNGRYLITFFVNNIGPTCFNNIPLCQTLPNNWCQGSWYSIRTACINILKHMHANMYIVTHSHSEVISWGTYQIYLMWDLLSNEEAKQICSCMNHIQRDVLLCYDCSFVAHNTLMYVHLYHRIESMYK